VRALISLAVVAGAVWAAFHVRLGKRTLAEHLDAIGQTQPAQELLEGARDTVQPALSETKERVLGEHVEAPTSIPARPLGPGPKGPGRSSSKRSSTGLPGRSGREAPAI
jgi:hypothetical protein